MNNYYYYFKYFLFVFCAAHLDAVKFRCDYEYHSVGWFKYYEMPMIWSDARFYCHVQGSELASPTTKEILNIMKKSIGKADIFTGIHATISNGIFHSIDGTPFSKIPHSWADSEPDNKQNAENCISLNSDGLMSDVRCDEPRPFICHREYSNKDVTICGTPDQEYHFDGRTNKCYKVHTIPRTFRRAHFVCAAEGGHLAIINSDEESTAIKELYLRYQDGNMLGNFRKDLAFVGFYNFGESVDWTTIHGQSIQDAGFAKFTTGEPNNSTNGEYCGSIWRTNGYLNDLWCEAPFPFICEKKPDEPPVCDHLTYEPNMLLKL